MLSSPLMTLYSKVWLYFLCICSVLQFCLVLSLFKQYICRFTLSVYLSVIFFSISMYFSCFRLIDIIIYYYAPFEEEVVHCFAHVGRSVGRSVTLLGRCFWLLQNLSRYYILLFYFTERKIAWRTSKCEKIRTRIWIRVADDKEQWSCKHISQTGLSDRTSSGTGMCKYVVILSFLSIFLVTMYLGGLMFRHTVSFVHRFHLAFAIFLH